MPKLKNWLPKVCRDRNQAFSWHNGRRIYHGVWGSPEAEKSYKRFKIALLENPKAKIKEHFGTPTVGKVLKKTIIPVILNPQPQTYLSNDSTNRDGSLL